MHKYLILPDYNIIHMTCQTSLPPFLFTALLLKNNYHYLQFIATLLFFLAKLVEILSIDMKNVVFAIYYTLLYYTFTAVGPQNHSNTYVT